jgi:hypothetical protein
MSTGIKLCKLSTQKNNFYPIFKSLDLMRVGMGQTKEYQLPMAPTAITPALLFSGDKKHLQWEVVLTH